MAYHIESDSIKPGHQVRCIHWKQVVIFNKGIVLFGLKFVELNIICEEYWQPSLYVMLQICLKITI